MHAKLQIHNANARFVCKEAPATVTYYVISIITIHGANEGSA